MPGRRRRTRGGRPAGEARLESAADEATGAKLRVERGKVTSFAQFPYDAAIQLVLADLDR